MPTARVFQVAADRLGELIAEEQQIGDCSRRLALEDALEVIVMLDMLLAQGSRYTLPSATLDLMARAEARGDWLTAVLAYAMAAEAGAYT